LIEGSISLLHQIRFCVTFLIMHFCSFPPLFSFQAIPTKIANNPLLLRLSQLDLSKKKAKKQDSNKKASSLLLSSTNPHTDIELAS